MNANDTAGVVAGAAAIAGLATWLALGVLAWRKGVAPALRVWAAFLVGAPLFVIVGWQLFDLLTNLGSLSEPTGLPRDPGDSGRAWRWWLHGWSMLFAVAMAWSLVGLAIIGLARWGAAVAGRTPAAARREVVTARAAMTAKVLFWLAVASAACACILLATWRSADGYACTRWHPMATLPFTGLTLSLVAVSAMIRPDLRRIVAGVALVAVMPLVYVGCQALFP